MGDSTVTVDYEDPDILEKTGKVDDYGKLYLGTEVAGKKVTVSGIVEDDQPEWTPTDLAEQLSPELWREVEKELAIEAGDAGEGDDA